MNTPEQKKAIELSNKFNTNGDSENAILCAMIAIEIFGLNDVCQKGVLQELDKMLDEILKK